MNKYLQKKAGTTGRKAGHKFEDLLVKKFNEVVTPIRKKALQAKKHLYTGNVGENVLNKIASTLDINSISKIQAFSTGKLATSETKQKKVLVNGKNVTASKSDVILSLFKNSKEQKIVGVSVKQCNKKTPTNDQIFFTTASAFCNLLNQNGIKVSQTAEKALKQFCGDEGFRPMDDCRAKKSHFNPERYYWEEIDSKGKTEWEQIFTKHQDKITKLILQKGYKEDPCPPSFIVHKTKKSENDSTMEVAIYSMDEFIKLSHKYKSFHYSEYRVCKGRYKEPIGTTHLAPRFGVIQMQRGGQRQHPTQLQFNLKSGYFYELEKL